MAKLTLTARAILCGAFLLVLSGKAGAQELTTARFAALPDHPETIRTAGERQAVRLQGGEIVIPQMILGGEWTTTLRFTNRGTAAITAGRAAFVDNAGKLVTVSLVSSSGATSAAAGIGFTLPPGGMFEANLAAVSDSVFGYVLIDPASCPQATSCSLYAEAILRNRNSTRPDFESVFPSEAATDLQYMLFDHRDGFSTVLYLINLSSSVTTAELEFRGTGNQLLKSVSVPLQSGEAQILTPHVLAPETIGQQGTMVIRAANPISTGLLVATGLRINPSNSFTPLRAFIPRP